MGYSNLLFPIAMLTKMWIIFPNIVLRIKSKNGSSLLAIYEDCINLNNCTNITILGTFLVLFIYFTYHLLRCPKLFIIFLFTIYLGAVDPNIIYYLFYVVYCLKQVAALCSASKHNLPFVQASCKHCLQFIQTPSKQCLQFIQTSPKHCLQSIQMRRPCKSDIPERQLSSSKRWRCQTTAERPRTLQRR